MTASRLRRRLTSLGLGELASAALFCVVAVLLFDGQPRPWLGVLATAPLVLVLVSAGIFWLAASRWVPGGVMPIWMARLYLAARWVLPAVELASFAVLVYTWPGLGLSTGLATAALLLGAAEYVNYFVVRISYPAVGWMREVRQRRIPRLMREVRRALT